MRVLKLIQWNVGSHKCLNKFLGERLFCGRLKKCLLFQFILVLASFLFLEYTNVFLVFDSRMMPFNCKSFFTCNQVGTECAEEILIRIHNELGWKFFFINYGFIAVQNLHFWHLHYTFFRLVSASYKMNSDFLY